MVVESKLLLDAMGIPWVQAPGEGEAQAAQMVKKGQAYAVASQDYDALLFGSPVLVRNISITGKRKVPRQDRYVMIEPEEIKLEETLSSLNLNQEQLIAIGILIGTDYNEGVKGIGPKTALKIVNEHVRFKKIMDFVKEKYKYEFDVEPEDVLDCFMHPKCDEVKASSALKKPNPDKIRSILVEQHDFSEERVMRTLDTLQEALKEKGSQRNLGQWF
jgi:flap endonuclease-1